MRPADCILLIALLAPAATLCAGDAPSTNARLGGAGPSRPRGSGAAIKRPSSSLSTAPKEIPRRQKELAKIAEIRKAISEKRLIRGMTAEQVKSSWGWPDWTHPVSGVNVSTDRWTYRRKGTGFIDLYFEDGVLVNIVK